MEPKIELKLLETLFQFKGMIFKNAQFKEKEIKRKEENFSIKKWGVKV